MANPREFRRGYSREEMRRLYAPSEPVELAGGRHTLVAQDAAKMAPGLLTWDATAGGYRRACGYPTDERAALDAGLPTSDDHLPSGVSAAMPYGAFPEMAPDVVPVVGAAVPLVGLRAA